MECGDFRKIMSDLIKIGTIVKPQGIKGEVKIRPYTQDVMRLSYFKSFILHGENRGIEKSRSNGNDLFIKFERRQRQR